MSNNLVLKKWNILDTFIYKFEKLMSEIRKGLYDSKEDIPDPEEIIAAATEQLQHENEALKKRIYPGNIIVEGDHYYCPVCHEELSPILIKKKFCPECGKRIVLQDNIYAASHKYEKVRA